MDKREIRRNILFPLKLRLWGRKLSEEEGIKDLGKKIRIKKMRVGSYAKPWNWTMSVLMKLFE